MSICGDNPRLGIVGCGATYSGELQHCVALVSWSEHLDGRAHITASLSLIDTMWKKGRTEPADPATIGFHQSPDGRWRWPDRGGTVPWSDETGDSA